MASVYFDPALGGDGSTVSDDSNPSTGLANGGHRYRFVGALAQVVAVAGWVLAQTNGVLASVAATQDSELAALAAAGQADAAARRAGVSAGQAQTSAAAAASSAASISLPALAGHGLNYLRVRADEAGYELRTAAQSRADLGIEDLEFLTQFLAG